MSIVFNFDNLFDNEFCKVIKKSKKRCKEQKEPIEKMPKMQKPKKSQAESMRKYRLNHNETIVCACGGHYRSYYTKSTHFYTKKHQKHLELCESINITEKMRFI